MNKTPFYRGLSIETGAWGPNTTWDVYATDIEPPAEDVSAAGCFAYHESTYELMLMQALHNGNPQWRLTAGHIAEPPIEDETPPQGAVRETFEESGAIIDINDLRLFAVRQLRQPGGYRRGGKQFDEQTFISYYIAPIRLPLKKPTGSDVLDRRYFPRAEAEALDIPDNGIIKLGFLLLERMRLSQ